ncbi:hypothetical protein Mal52_42860 [Symmachiella dynata]|uniref:Secreted protein n=1 Tax=Symmachiella dynata TaxID=2527995 RepID=A0A517ZTK4_9PLAN|nr:hypothetical protein [Symmachiella dynata]QDU45790.1 hypothetical protein Mal52_42860 [Symmachiella dynata]
MQNYAWFAVIVMGTVSVARAAEPIQPAAANFEQSIFSAAEPADFASQWGVQPVSCEYASSCNGCNNCLSCGTGGCGCGCGCGYECGSGLSFLKGDHCFDSFIEPTTNPVFFEDPRARTRVRGLFINQMIPEDSILQGGDFQVYAVQLSVALSDRFAVIANKDGYIKLQSDALPNNGGWADLATGVKYVMVRDVENQFLLSGGVLYEWANGSSDVYQGNGDGMWNFFLTTGKELGEDSHFIGTVGWHLPNNPNQESESMFYSLHLDNEVVDDVYVLWEMNGIQYLQSGNRLPGVSVEGGDLINLGAGDVAGNHVLTMAWGAALILTDSLRVSGAWEIPLTSRKDLLDSRTTITMSWIY